MKAWTFFKVKVTSVYWVAGAIPDSFGTADNLKVFDVKLNNLTAFPSAWTNASYNAINSSYSNIRASFNNISVRPQLLNRSFKSPVGHILRLQMPSSLQVCF